ncbi:MAG: prepilin-type N-terminal cleavage/methylation domain-containing protein [Bryobacteraceae bacterium]|jgi:type II secretory pathway pseudopilin PulG
MRRSSRAGVTLIEITIAITLLSLLSLGMAIAIRVGLQAFAKTDAKLMDIRKITGAQNILHQELEGLIPVLAACGSNTVDNGFKAAFFQGEPAALRIVSSFSLQQGWRGEPQVLELFVIPGERDGGVRLVVNESLYTGYLGSAAFCTGVTPDAATGAPLPKFVPVAAGPKSFVLADQLAYCRFSYYYPGNAQENKQAGWVATWAVKGWPEAIRIEMAPLRPDPSRIQPITMTAPIHIRRDPEKKYEDAY